MRICRFNGDRLGVVKGTQVHDVTGALELLSSYRYPLPTHDVFIERLSELLPRMEALAEAAPGVPIHSVRLESPIANPGKLIAAPVNYTRHLEEVLAQKELHHGNHINEIYRAGLFLKATSSLVGPADPIRLTLPDRRTDHEVELAIVIGKQGRDIDADHALDYVAGYCIGLDITIRGPEERSLRKSPDGYSILGPWLTTADEIAEPGQLDFSLSVSGELRQSANTNELILGVRQLIEFASRFYTLYPGDVIFTGTPQGVGPIKQGDIIDADIEGLGSIRVAVAA